MHCLKKEKDEKRKENDELIIKCLKGKDDCEGYIDHQEVLIMDLISRISEMEFAVKILTDRIAETEKQCPPPSNCVVWGTGEPEAENWK